MQEFYFVKRKNVLLVIKTIKKKKRKKNDNKLNNSREIRGTRDLLNYVLN